MMMTLWDQYHWQMIAGLTALLLQTAIIIWLVIEHRRRRVAEIEARQRLFELAHINRVVTAGELSASIAHEINQPLAAIVSNANAGLLLLAESTPNLDEVRAALTDIVSDGHRASHMIGNIRAMFKKDIGDRTPVDVNEVIQEVVELVHGELHKLQISVQSELTDVLSQISADRVQLQQVILNLIVNAIDAMGSVTNHARVLRVRSEPHNPDGVLISIEDSGTGIDTDKHGRIFEAFYTTKAQGMGMGLSICRSIIEAHGGHLSVSPGYPHGSVFRVVLPTGKSAHA